MTHRLRSAGILALTTLAFGDAQQSVEFVRPGLAIKVISAAVGPDGTISATYSLADPNGLALDAAGISTPGTIGLSFIAAFIPHGQEQYSAYTIRTSIATAPNPALPSAIQASSDSGGMVTPLSNPGQYQYVFKTHATAGFDTSATHTIGIYGSRNLSVYGLPTNYASTTFNFVPSGAPVVSTRDVVRTATCNTCHDQLSAHGGSRRGVELCVLCHTPQSTDPNTGNTVDFVVMAHKIHMGSQLPSVIAGRKYGIVGFGNTFNDFSDVVDPADPRRCQTCHNLKSGAAQATAFLTKPTIAACGACHDDVNFATGVNHPGGPQIDNSQCADCHIAQGQLDFDASIIGAHVVPTESASLSGINLAISGIANGTAGSHPTVSFTLRDSSGNGIPLTLINNASVTMAGPATDYGYTDFGANATTPGYVTESILGAAGASCAPDGSCRYTLSHAVPANAGGTYAIGMEARRIETVFPGTTTQKSVTYGAVNPVSYFSVDGSSVQPRRKVVATANCNQCHYALSLHGTLRNNTEYCVMCHNPSNSDFTQRPNAVVASDKALPPQGIDFDLLVHRIHSGPNVVADGGKPYIVVGFGGSHNDFSDTGYPAMSPTGATGDTRNCAMCHANGSEQNLPAGLNAVIDPQGRINPDQPIAAACTGCHTSTPAASHALANTTILGESCQVCHSAGTSFAVSQVHAQD